MLIKKTSSNITGSRDPKSRDQVAQNAPIFSTNKLMSAKVGEVLLWEENSFKLVTFVF